LVTAVVVTRNRLFRLPLVAAPEEEEEEEEKEA
jgi:hypothetical protein